MSQFELVEDYLTNRLDDGARIAFEQRMESDPQLKAEVNMQQGIIEGVKKARAAELKAMLNNVPVGGGASSAVTGKIALATLSAGLVGIVLYFSLRSDAVEDIHPQVPEEVKTEEQLTPVEPQDQETTADSPEENKKPEVVKEAEAASPKKGAVAKKVSPPQIEVLDLTKDIEEQSEASSAPKIAANPTVSASTVEVELDNSNKSYPFHYQFKSEKLVLYGPFDSSLYEIIEINGGIHTLFLYYKNSYYHLDDKEQNIVPLIMIRDQELLSKLDKYRKGK